jgi:hypothetical protein
MDLYLLSGKQAAEVIRLEGFGGPEISRITQALSETLSSFFTCRNDNAKLCACCPRKIWRPNKIGIIMAHSDGPSQFVTFGLCKRCSSNSVIAYKNAIKAFQVIWPDSRPLANIHFPPSRT